MATIERESALRTPFSYCFLRAFIRELCMYVRSLYYTIRLFDNRSGCINSVMVFALLRFYFSSSETIMYWNMVWLVGVPETAVPVEAVPYSHSGYDVALWSSLSVATSYQYLCGPQLFKDTSLRPNHTAILSREKLPSDDVASCSHLASCDFIRIKIL